MIISLRLKNFYSLRDEVALDFTAEVFRKKQPELPENLIEFSGDKFINIIGLFGSNAAGKSNIIKAIDFCRRLILDSHQYNEGTSFDYQPFKFAGESPSEFSINFVTDGVEYEYSFTLNRERILSESLYYFPKRRRARIFSREHTNRYEHRKGLIQRPTEVEANTGPQTLFLSRASSMNRQIARTVYRFFLNEMIVAQFAPQLDSFSREIFEANKVLLLKAFEVSDSDIIDIRLNESAPGQFRLVSYHRENPAMPFDFDTEESEGTKRLFYILLKLLDTLRNRPTIFIDEFDLKLHLRLAEFILDVIRATNGAQLVFTTHTSMLINTARLRPDQIVFATKHTDGNSEFVPLSDYEGINKIADLQQAYLLGRFDGVPYVGDISRILHEMMDK